MGSSEGGEKARLGNGRMLVAIPDPLQVALGFLLKDPRASSKAFLLSLSALGASSSSFAEDLIFFHAGADRHANLDHRMQPAREQSWLFCLGGSWTNPGTVKMASLPLGWFAVSTAATGGVARFGQTISTASRLAIGRACGPGRFWRIKTV